MTPRDPSRRRLLSTIAALPLAGLAGATAFRLGTHAPLLRPGARGTTADRCAQCGSADHTMLTRGCPAAPEVL